MRVALLVEGYVHSSYEGDGLELVLGDYVCLDPVLLRPPYHFDFVVVLECLCLTGQVEVAFHGIVL